MKHFLICMVCLISSSLYSQIGKSGTVVEPTEIGSVERTLGKYISVYTLSLFEKGGNNFYVLAFTNEQTLYDDNSPDQKGLFFTATQDEFEYLYNFLLEGFEEDQTRYLEVGEDLLRTLIPINKFLYIHVDFIDGTSASLKLKKRELLRLFGKEKSRKKGKRK